MTPQTIALLAVAVVFALLLLWRARPAFLDGGRGAGYREALRKAQGRIEAAKTDAEKAAALCDAADACAMAFGRSSAAVSYYLRAARLAPTSEAILKRALEGLHPKPRALETFLWRRMAHADFAKEPKKLQRETLVALARVYDQGPKGRRVQADALRHLASVVGAGATDPET